MDFFAISRYSRVSPRKALLVADAIKSLSPGEALTMLSFVEKKSAGDILKKTLATAFSSVPQAQRGSMRFAKIEVLPAGAMKRFRAVSRGMAHTYKKRMSHIKIVLTDSKKSDTKSVLTIK